MRTLLVGKIGVVDQCDPPLIGTAGQDPPEFGPGRLDTPRQHQCRVAQIEERDLSTVVDGPSVP